MKPPERALTGVGRPPRRAAHKNLLYAVRNKSRREIDLTREGQALVEHAALNALLFQHGRDAPGVGEPGAVYVTLAGVDPGWEGRELHFAVAARINALGETLGLSPEGARRRLSWCRRRVCRTPPRTTRATAAAARIAFRHGAVAPHVRHTASGGRSEAGGGSCPAGGCWGGGAGARRRRAAGGGQGSAGAAAGSPRARAARSRAFRWAASPACPRASVWPPPRTRTRPR